MELPKRYITRHGQPVEIKEPDEVMDKLMHIDIESMISKFKKDIMGATEYIMNETGAHLNYAHLFVEKAYRTLGYELGERITCSDRFWNSIKASVIDWELKESPCMRELELILDDVILSVGKGAMRLSLPPARTDAGRARKSGQGTRSLQVLRAAP